MTTEQTELVSLCDRSDHVENCAENHFMELLEDTKTLPDETNQMKKQGMENKRLHMKIKS